MSYKHGVYISEADTSVVTTSTAEAALPIIVGTAPVHNLADGTEKPINEPELIYTFSEFVKTFGALGDDENEADFTLYQAAKIYLSRYKIAPIVAINVFDPSEHRSDVAEEGTFSSAGKLQLPHLAVSQLQVIALDGSATYVEGTDYTLDAASGLVKRLSDGAIAEGATVVVSYSYADPTKVTKDDVIGGTLADGTRTGLQLVEETFPRFRLTPGQVLAPKYSEDPSVGLAIISACTVGSDVGFRSIGIIDVPDSVEKYSDVPAWLEENNLKSSYLMCFFGHCLYDDVLEPGSVHLAACCGSRDAANGDIPFYSPSNFTLSCEGLEHNGKTLNLTPAEAAYLNGQGIVTGLNMIGGLKCWGDQTTCYPDVTDVKESSIPIRRMFNWIGNTLILTAWQFVSNPLRRRLIETVRDTFNIWLNGLTAKEAILGGRVEFETEDNSTSDLLDGKVTWHVYVTPPQAARELNFTLEYDVDYLENLFSDSE